MTRAAQPKLRAELLLAGLTAEQLRHWLRDNGRDPVELAQHLSAAATDLARSLASNPAR
ncbi:MAG: hypothetical protein ACRDQZ_16860 [Mycobacteriales bacterium]